MFLAKYSETTSVPTFLSETNNIQLFPNPTTTTINLSIENPNEVSAIQVYDLMGKVVYQDAHFVLQYSINNSPTIQLPLLPDGIYTLKVLSSKSVECKQFVIKH